MGAELRCHLLSLRFRGRLRSLGLRHWVLISAYGREEEVQEREARDDPGREERRPQTDEVADDSGGERCRWRDGERPSSRVAYTTRTPCTANHSMFASAIAVMERRTIGCSRTQRRPSVTSCHTLLMDSRGRGVSAERMAAMKTADTRKPTASLE